MAKRTYNIPKPKGGVNWGANGFARAKGSSHYGRYFNPWKSPGKWF